jgi:hypothetical protein
MDAWLPVAMNETAVGRALIAPLEPGASWMAAAYTWVAAVLAGLPWPVRLAWVPLAATALAAALLCVGFRRAGLPGIAATLLALLASSGPLAWTQATTPLGAAVVSAAAAALALLVSARTRASWVAAVIVILGGTSAFALTTHAGSGRASNVLDELGSPGLVLLLLGLLAGRRPDGTGYWRLALVGAGAWALVSPLGAMAQVAAAAPFAWTLVAAGLVALVGWRRHAGARRTTVWLTLGLVAWTAVQAAARPWLARRDMTVLARQWAEAVAGAALDAPLVIDATPASRLVEAWARDTPAFERRVATDALAESTTQARVPLTLLPALADAGRWMGLSPASSPLPLATLATLAATLPADVVVGVGLSQSAAARLTPDAWHALATLGSRIGPGGTARARALVGVTGGRAAGSEMAGAPEASLMLLPGDLIGQTGRPSPLDLRIEADAGHVRLFERDRLRMAAPGVVVAVYRRNGVRLALWSGPDAHALNAGVPGTDGPVVGRANGVLVCRDLPARTPLDVTALSTDGALGVEAPTGTRVRLSTTWPGGHPAATPQVVGLAIERTPTSDHALNLRVVGNEPFGIHLRGRPASVRWEADMPARVCQAPPVAPPAMPSAAPPAPRVDVHPRVEAAFGGGWHDMEPMGGGRYFRWMAGPRAVLLLTLTDAVDDSPSPLLLALDAQSVGVPGPADRLRVAINGEWLDPRALMAGRAAYTWTVPASLMRVGLNEVLVETTVTLRPSHVSAGADGRLLGLALYGWTLARADLSQSTDSTSVVPGR